MRELASPTPFPLKPRKPNLAFARDTDGRYIAAQAVANFFVSGQVRSPRLPPATGEKNRGPATFSSSANRCPAPRPPRGTLTTLKEIRFYESSGCSDLSRPRIHRPADRD